MYKRQLDNGGVRLADISASARRSLAGAKGDQGPQGPPGLTFHASLNSAGAIVRGNAVGGGKVPGDGVYAIQWNRDVSGCDALATLASVAGGVIVDPPAGRITVRTTGNSVEVRTYDASGVAADLPFSVAVAC